MRWLILTQYFPPEIGAPQVRLAALTGELRRLGHEVEVVTSLPNYPTGRLFPEYQGRFYVREQWDGVSVHRVWLYPSMGAGVRRLANYLSFSTTVLVPLLRVKRPDILFVESPPIFLCLPAILAARRWRIPMILNIADLWPDSVRELGLMRNSWLLRLAERLERWSYQEATFVNAVTEGIQKTLVQQKRVSPEKVLFLPNGVDTELFKPRPPDVDLARQLDLDGKKIILYAGTLGFAQGLQVAIQAMSLLQDAVPEACLVFIGDGSERARLEQQARALQLKNVRFLPPNQPAYVARLYSLAVAGLVTLRNVPLFDRARPSKMFPIMASGKPVVYSGSGEGARLVESANAGVVVSPEDPKALAEAIRTLVGDPALADELGRNGRRYVEEKLSWSTLVKDWLHQLEARNVVFGK